MFFQITGRFQKSRPKIIEFQKKYAASQPWDNIGLGKQVPKLSEIKIPEFFAVRNFIFKFPEFFPVCRVRGNPEAYQETY